MMLEPRRVAPRMRGGIASLTPRAALGVLLLGLLLPGCHTGSSHSGESAAARGADNAASDRAIVDRIATTPWLEPRERRQSFPFAFRLTDQKDRLVTRERLSGKPFAITFLYTRCENPFKCPKVAERFGELQAALRKQGLEGKATLLLATYDPSYDSPERFVEYAHRYQIEPDDHALLIRPDNEQKQRFFRALDIAVNYNTGTVTIHRIQLLLFDGRGRYVRSYQSLMWDNDRVAQDLQRLTEEPSS
jgi:cytochrome oxidase Cu insertion factor (SCO1/SenC/PrrC family)